MISSLPRPALLAVLAMLGLLTGCNRKPTVGDHVYVTWSTHDYPAIIREAPTASKFKVHFDGYDDTWDQEVTKDRVKGFVEGTPINPEPPDIVRVKALKAAQTNHYQQGAKVRVEWHGQIYGATINGIVGPERYRIRYDGYGPEWDEVVGISRIQQQK